MRTLELEEARKVMAGCPEFRISDIPIEGYVLLHKEGIVVSVNSEGEVTLFSLDPNA